MQLLTPHTTRCRLIEHVNRRGLASGLIVVAAIVAALWYWLDSRANTPSPTGAAEASAPRAVVVIAMQPLLKSFDDAVEALGTVRANESVDITAKVADRIAAIHFKEGQQVRRGQLLVELDSDEARADLAAAQAAFGDSRSQFKRSQELYQTRALSEAQMEQVQAALSANEARLAAARSRINDRLIAAPFDGRVGLRQVSLGGLVSPGEVITTLDDLSVVKVDFSIPEVFLAALEAGLPITARSSAYPAMQFEGSVAAIGTRVDPATRSVAIRAVIDNREGRLRPGMFMTVSLVRTQQEALMLPERAIVPENAAHYVFVVEQGLAHKRQVAIGRRRPGEVEILEGVHVDDTVIVDGTLNVREGTPVRLQGQAPDTQPSPT